MWRIKNLNISLALNIYILLLFTNRGKDLLSHISLHYSPPLKLVSQDDKLIQTPMRQAKVFFSKFVFITTLDC